jgi:hypothetical protein
MISFCGERKVVIVKKMMMKIVSAKWKMELIVAP